MASEPQTRSPGQLARELFEIIFDRKDPDALRPYGTEDSVDHFLALGIDVRGPDEIIRYFRELNAAVPDATMMIKDIVEDDRHAAVQWTFMGNFEVRRSRDWRPPASDSLSAAATSSASPRTARSARTPSTTTARSSPARSGCCRRATRWPQGNDAGFQRRYSTSSTDRR